ncbi:MAG: hypothetical protein FJ405_01720 [Verrucomicrobia bacterium]|nr:hypothetical protein [Verrucomicrobiota bacterium]
MSTSGPKDPIWLLVRVGALSMWRRGLAIRQQSRLLTLCVALFLGGYMFMTFQLFAGALKFMGRFPGVGSMLTEPLMFLLFAFLFVLLFISNLIIGYSNLFRNREAAFLLTRPIPFESVFQWKLLESSLLASWAFLLLIAPFLAAFGYHKRVDWHFYPVSFGLLGLFVLLPGVLGCFAALVVGRFLDRKWFHILALGIGISLLLAGGAWYRGGNLGEDLANGRIIAMLDQLLNRTLFAQFPLLPSYWLTSAVMRWAEGAYAAAGFYILVILSNALFLCAVAASGLGRGFYRATAEAQGRDSVFGRWSWAQRRPQGFAALSVSWIERVLARIPGLGSEVQALIVKDGRMFWRDATQWVQTLMLFGLLAVYVFNIRYFSQQFTGSFWIHLVAFLNLGACTLNLATLTTRFVFPQFSLEGKRIWIVGMAPIGLERIVWIKFWVATSLSLVLTLSLIVLSSISLGFTAGKTALFCVATAVMTVCLNAMAVGVGAMHPNFREDQPSKIVSGFGGTLCLMLSFLYIVISVALLALVATWRTDAPPSALRITAGAAGFLVLSVSLGLTTMRLGLERVRTLEV